MNFYGLGRMTKRFDYGEFPDASEEIWDWFVVARVRDRVRA